MVAVVQVINQCISAAEPPSIACPLPRGPFSPYWGTTTPDKNVRSRNKKRGEGGRDEPLPLEKGSSIHIWHSSNRAFVDRSVQADHE
jgi:hypothetical protein